ncbi:MAG TPA: aldo/keto reductase [Candidatus Mediterraneibacter norfolkensis]|nr:aldo/keto reductase [Candidatus Mediterraneibacter norfolkensis]
MLYTNMGKTGLRVSRLCLGTMNFGKKLEESESDRIMDAALDAGINMFDTADEYGAYPGQCEEIVGRWLSREGHRQRVIVSSKVFNPVNRIYGVNDEPGLSCYRIQRYLEETLTRLKSDHLDIYYMHHVDEKCTWTELWDGFERAYLQGKIDYIGANNFAAWQMVQGQMESDRRNFLGISVIQHRYNLLSRYAELEVLPAAQKFQISVIPWAPVELGLLCRNALNASEEMIHFHDMDLKMRDREREKLVQYSRLCEELGEAEESVALAWLLANPAVTSLNILPHSVEHLNLLLRGIEIRLSEDVLKKLDEIFPGFKPAPYHYAW